MRRLTWSVLGANVACVLASRAFAATIFVTPGPGTPLQDAIDAAAPGDTVRLSAGLYPEKITITKALKLRGKGAIWHEDVAEVAALDGACVGGPMITVAASDVSIRELAIINDRGGAVQISGVSRVKVKKMFAPSNCNPPTAPTFDVVQSTRVKLDDVWVGCYSEAPAGIRLASLAAGADVRVKRSIVGNCEIGILVEDSGPAAVRVSGNAVNFNDTGIALRNSDGNRIDRNRLSSNSDLGVTLDATSDGNLLVGNRVLGSTADVSDAGTGNCWRNTTFQTGSVPPCP